MKIPPKHLTLSQIEWRMMLSESIEEHQEIIKRMREALEEIADSDDGALRACVHIKDIARAALEGK